MLNKHNNLSLCMIFALPEDLPLWIIFIFTFVIIVIAFQIGIILGKKHHSIFKREDRSPIGSLVAANLGLLAFFLAFAFGLAASRLDDRRELIIDEANTIGTTYLRAEYLPDPLRTQIEDLLKEYINVRLNTFISGNLAEDITRSEELQDQLWQLAVKTAEKEPNSVIVGLFIQSLNELIELHAKRINIGIRIRIPLIIWITLYLVAIFSISSLGYQFGLTNARYIGLTLLLISTFSIVLLLVVDLDRPLEGFIQVNQQPLIELKERFSNPRKL